MNPSLHLYRRPHSCRRESFVENAESAVAVVQQYDQEAPAIRRSAGAGVAVEEQSNTSPTPSYASTKDISSSAQSSVDNIAAMTTKSKVGIGSGNGTENDTQEKDDDDDNNNGKIKKGRCMGLLQRHDNDWWQTWSENWMFSHWPILLVSCLVFAILAGAGIAMYLVIAQSQEDDLEDKIMDLAVETGAWFSKELDFAIMPLFSMAQFATELDTFKDLPEKIKPVGQPGALPLYSNDDPNYTDGRAVRNVTGVCDDPKLVSRFTQIASAVKSNANMEGILHNIQLAPEGVICLLHPMNNTEDFDDKTSYLDNTGAWGIDLFHDPILQYVARQSIKQKQVGIAGPRILHQCPTCGLYFIIRLPIVSRTHHIEIDGESYPRWGFATALINWDALLAKGGIHERFHANGYGFQLTRTDRTFKDETGLYDEEIVVLAESDDYGEKGKQVSTALQTTNSEWVITIQYERENETEYILVILSTLLVAFFIAALVYTVLLQKQSHMAVVGNAASEKEKAELEQHLTAALAHELRNPLSAIDSALQIMPSNIPEEAKELVVSMQLCTVFMQSIMTNLLDSRKLEEGKMTLLNNPISLKTMLGDIHKMMMPAVMHDVQWLVDVNTISEEKEWVFGDAKRIQQILTNLISNAIKHTRKGSITISATWTKADNNAGDKREWVKLMCRDTGPGIPVEDQADLFNRFTTRGGAPGSGLGLAIARQLVGLMGGSIWFESDPTVKPGTDCIVMLPLKLCDVPQQPATEEFSEPSAVDDKKPLTEPITVLITDDIKMNRTMLKRRFQKCIAPNCIIAEAATGEETIKMCETRTFDLIIMDQFMMEAGGVLVGTDVVIALRRADVKSVIIGCSGNDLDEKFLAAGADTIWKKPVPSNAAIIKSLRHLLALKGHC